MNGPSTISKVIAFELGLLVAVLTWIAFAGIPGVKTHPVAQAEEPADGSFANVSPVYQPRQSQQPAQTYRRAPVNYPANDVQMAQVPARAPAQVPAQISVARVQTYDPGLTGAGYDDTVDARGQLSYGVDEPSGNVEGYVVNQDPANYIGTFPEPVLDSPYDYYYGRPYGYTQPVEVVILNNNRGFSRRNVGNHCNFAGGPNHAPHQNPRMRSRGQGVTRPSPVAMGPSVHPGPRVNDYNSAAQRRIATVQKARPGPASQPRRTP
jgi:hypothetical protein